MSEHRKNHCESCHLDRITDEANTAWETLEDLVGSWSGDLDEAVKVKKLLTLAKKLSK